MLDQETISRVAKHKMLHDMGFCSCPCFDALITVGEALKKETKLRVEMAKASPEVLAALTIGAADADPEC